MGYLEKVCKDIKTVRIQGAQNIAEAAIAAWNKSKNKKDAEKKLAATRPTEPMLRNVLRYLAENDNAKELLRKVREDKQKIARIGAEKIQDGQIVFTHCHSSTVTSMLIEAKKQRKKFEVYNTETRPWYQGRTTSAELAKAKIPVTLFVDSAARIALKKSDLMLIGADAITSEGVVINKIGSEMFSEIAENHEVPVYSCTHSWKFDPLTFFGFEETLERIDEKGIWKDHPKGVKINTYIFEKINPKLITGIICEMGVFSPHLFVEEVKKNYGWMLE